MLLRIWRSKYPFHCWWECGWAQPFWTVCQYPVKINRHICYDPEIPLQCLYPKVILKQLQRGICVRILGAILFMVTKSWRQPECMALGKRTQNMWWILTIQYYSVVESRRLYLHREMHFGLENIVDSEKCINKFLYIYFVYIMYYM